MKQSAKQNPFNDLPDDKIFKNRDYLTPERTPTYEEFKERDEQIEKIKSLLRHVQSGGIPENFLITGPSGAGKTACAKMMVNFLAEAFEDNNIDHTYIHDIENERSALQRLSVKLDLTTEGRDKPYRGNDLERYYELLVDKIVSENKDLILIIDELEDIFNNPKKKKDHGNSLIKKLWERRKLLKDKEADCSLTIIGITNSVRVDESFNSRVASRLSEEIIEFPAYDATELKTILRTRAQKAFNPKTIEEGVISKAAALAAKKGGDARYGLVLLRKAADLAVEEESDKAYVDHVDRANEVLERNKILDAVKESNKKAKLTLYTILENRSECPMTTREAHDFFTEVCESNGLDTVSQRWFKNYLNELDNRGLIKAPIESRGKKGGRSRRIKIDDLSTDLMDKIQDEIEENIFELQ